MNTVMAIFVYAVAAALCARWHVYLELIPLTLFFCAVLIAAQINRDSWQAREAGEILAFFAVIVFVVACIAQLVVLFL